MEKKTVKVGVIGLGKMGLLHASILSVLPNVQLSAICDKNALIVKFAGKIFKGVRVVNDFDELTDLNLDAVYITTPIPSHFPVVEFICSKRVARNLFVEKTLASSYDEAMKLHQLGQNLGGINMVGYMSRFAVTFRRAKELLNQEAIGRVNSFKAYAYSSDFIGIKKKSAPRGGALRDLAAHVVDLALWFFGDLEVKRAKLEPSIQDEDLACFKVEGYDGLEGEFDISWSKEGYRTPEWGFLIKGSKATIKVDNDSLKLERDDGTSVLYYRHNLNDSVTFLLGAPEYFREDEYFINCILKAQNAEPSFFTASKIDFLIDQVKYKGKK